MSATDYLENAVLNHVYRNTALTSPATVYAALFTTATADAGTGTEVTGGSYAREAITFGAPSPAGTISNSAIVDFGTATAAWGTVTHFATFDALTGGNMLDHGPLTVSKVVADTDPVSFPIGTLVITRD